MSQKQDNNRGRGRGERKKERKGTDSNKESLLKLSALKT